MIIEFFVVFLVDGTILKFESNGDVLDFGVWGTVGCNDEDECTSGSHNCVVDVICINIGGSFICACNIGYFGDVIVFCILVDEC